LGNHRDTEAPSKKNPRENGGDTDSSLVLELVFSRAAKAMGCYRLDLAVEDELIVELKTVEKVLPIHKLNY
jgi:hypothetical protein